MCSIFGSRDKEEFYELAKLNSYRGVHSHSLYTFHSDNSILEHSRDFGPMRTDIDLPNDCMYIGHQQAPTTDAKSMDNIHPAKRHSLLWHNGIIKDYQVKKWQEEFVTEQKWDTYLLQTLIEEKGLPALSEADGSFACLQYNSLRSLLLFRNSNCPMFVKGDSFSSTKFEGSESIKENVVYVYDNKWIETTIKFETANEFYWSPA